MSAIIDIRHRNGPVRVLATDEEASAAARKLFAAPGIDNLLRSGLLGINVPADLGGADVSNATLSEIIADLAAAAPETGLLLARHAAIIEAIRAHGSEAQSRHFLARALSGTLFATIDQQAALPLEADGPGYRLAGPVPSHHTGCLAAAVRLPDGVAALCLLDANAKDDRASDDRASDDAGFVIPVGVDRVFVLAENDAGRIARATARLFVSSARLGEARALATQPSGEARDRQPDDQQPARSEVELAAASALLDRAGRLADIAQVGSPMVPVQAVERAERLAAIKVSDALSVARHQARQRQRPDAASPTQLPASFTVEPLPRPEPDDTSVWLW